MNENKIVNGYYQSNIETSRNEDSVYAIKYASQQMLINKLKQQNAELKEKINTYENPKDLTLFYMWLDEKTKDKIKELEKENQMLKLTVEKLTKTPYQYDIRGS